MELTRTLLVAACVTLSGSAQAFAQADTAKPINAPPVVVEAGGPLLVNPYLQLGHAQADRRLVLVWQTTEGEATWVVEYKPGAGRRWQTAPPPLSRRIAVAGVEPHTVWRACWPVWNLARSLRTG